MTVLPTRYTRRRPGVARTRVIGAAVLCALAMTARADDAPMQELDCLVEPFLVVDVGSARGIVKAVAVDRSDTVQKSDVLVRLDDSEQAATVRQARARANMTGELRAREAALAFAQRKLERISELYSSDAISNFQRDEVQTELEMATQQLRQAEEARNLARLDLERAKIELERRIIRSPVDGIVIERFVSPGEFINDTPLVRVAQMNPLRVEAIAPSSMFGSVRPGMAARITAGLQGDTALTATVTIVDRLIDPASNTFGIRLELPNPDYAIPSGLNCRLSLEPVSADNGAQREIETPVRSAPRDGALSASAKAKAMPPPAWGKPTAKHRVSKPTVTAATVTTGNKDRASAPTPGKMAASPSVTNGATTAPDQAVTPGSAASCMTLGPIDDTQLWRQLQLALAAEPVAVTARTDDDHAQIIGYFVLTQRLQSMQDTRDAGANLRRQGVADLAVLTRSPYAQRVSLGLYSTIKGAQQRKAQFDAMNLGVTTEILPRTRTDARHWLDVSAATDVLETRPWSALAPDLGAVACDNVSYVAEAKAGAR